MCLMCEHHVDSCNEQKCIDAADDYDVFTGRSGITLYLWRGYGEPCEHIKNDLPDWEDYLNE